MIAEPNQEVFHLLDKLQEVTVKMHEALAFEKFEQLPALSTQRQGLIDELGDFDAGPGSDKTLPSWSKDDKFRSKLDKLLLTGEALLAACTKRLAQLAQIRRQGSVIRATARGYKPYSPSPISTRKVES